jgi:Ca-activated chloride channel family protein
MKLSTDDPKLTAYALGELDDAARAEVEAALRDSAECRQTVDDIRRTAGWLTAELEREPCPEFPVERREAVLGATPAGAATQPVSKTIGAQNHEETFSLTPALSRWERENVSQPLDKTERALSEAERDAIHPLPMGEGGGEGEGNRKETTPQGGESGSKIIPFPSRRWAAGLGAIAASIALVAAWNLWKPAARSVKKNAPNAVLALGLGVTNQPITVGVVKDAVFAPQPGFNTNVNVVLLQTNGRILVGGDFASYNGSNRNRMARLNPAGTADPNSQSYAVNDNGGASTVTVFRRDGLGDTVSVQYQITDGTATSYDLFDSSAPDPAKPVTVWALGVQPDGQVLTANPYGASTSSLYFPQRRLQSLSEKESQLAQLRQSVQSATPQIAQLEQEVKLLKERQEAERLSPITAYEAPRENPFLWVSHSPLSTFSIDVDTASYANVRRFLNAGQLPPREAVRIEELVNYFSYRYPQPRGDEPFAANIEVAACPWNRQHRLVRVGLKGREIASEKRPPSNFVFLIDVSGSMQPTERLPLIKQGLRMLVKKMNAGDRVAMVVYASSSGTVLASTSCEQKEKILEAIDRLEAGGSTNGGEGIQRAYAVAQENFIKGGVNRVILCTDGDFNVGMTDQNQLVTMIQEKAKAGVFLTTLGVGTDNYKDALMMKLADKGNGNYHYLDSVEEAHKVLVEQMNGTLVTIAKDVKIQIEFNPAQAAAYRLVGYEKRLMRARDFNDDTKDAGEIGAGHTITALYEVVPAGTELRPAVDNLKYQQPAAKPERYSADSASKELLTLKLRYKQPEGDTSKLLEVPVTDRGASYGQSSGDFKFAGAVAAFGQLLRDSEFKGSASFDAVIELAEESKGEDKEGYRAEFINLVKRAKALKK